MIRLDHVIDSFVESSASRLAALEDAPSTRCEA
jgi:hypothetical protein